MALLVAPATHAVAGSCPAGDFATEWQGMRVVTHEDLGDGPPAWAAFCRNGRLVRRFRTKRGQYWKAFRAIDLDGDGKTELASWYWSGGAHCCTTYVVFRRDRRRGVVATELAQDDGDSGVEWQRLSNYPRPVLLATDNSAAYFFGPYSSSVTLPYVVEIGPQGFRLAEAVMRARRPGWGPAALYDGPRDWSDFLRNIKDYQTMLADVAPPAKRLNELHELIATWVEVGGGPASPYLIELHVKLYCFYAPSCDIPALVREVEGRHRGFLTEFRGQLVTSLRDSNVTKLRRAPAGWH
jgi:hypothetical protein